MTFQDIIFTFGTVGFTLGLLPTIIRRQAPNSWTCFFHVVILLFFALAHASLGFWFAAGATLACTTGWFTLFIQALLRTRAKKSAARSVLL